MNFYKHHLGDYAAATVRLTWDEETFAGEDHANRLRLYSEGDA